jgi:hypothetical protein
MRTIRFSDSARSLHSYVQGQYSDILSGVNPRDASAACGNAGATGAGASSCLLLGKLMRFETGSSQVTTYYVIATRIPDLAGVDATLSDEQLIANAAKPVIVKSVGVDTFDIPWDAKILGSRRSSDASEANTYVLLRSPRSSRLVSYTFNLSNVDFNNTTSLMPYLVPAATQKATNYCIQGVETPGPPAAITVAGGQGQGDIKVEFDINPSGNCDHV